LNLPEEGCDLDAVLGEVERNLLLQALDRASGVRKNAAEVLGITFRSLRYRLDKHGLGGDDQGPPSEP
jgi:two-component system response regulator PilR (NtrC family)